MTERQLIPFTTEDAWRSARATDITSTTVSALFGVSPFLTPFELWHRLHGSLAVDDIENERTEVGLMLQDGIAAIAARRNGWTLRRMDEYLRMPSERIGSSFDFGGALAEFCATLPAQDKPAFIVEAKNVDFLEFRKHWAMTDYGLEAPVWIECQVQHQMLVADVSKCYIVALVGGNTLHVLERERDDVIAQRILDAAAEFWARTEPPAPDFRQDAATISRLYGYSSAGKVIEADTRMRQLMDNYCRARDQVNIWKDEMDSSKSELLMLIGDAEKVIGDGATLSAKVIGEKEIAAHVRKGYRDFRINERSSK